MKVIGSVTSPFTRFVRVACEELQIPYEFEVTPPFSRMTKDEEERLQGHNPLMRVPILIDGDHEIMDSRIIVGYLLGHPQRRGDFGQGFAQDSAANNNLTVILGIADAGVLRFVLKATAPEMKMDQGYMARSLARIESGLGWLDRRSSLKGGFGVAEAALISVLEWFTKRGIVDWSAYPNIVKAYKETCERPSLVKTRIPQSV